MDSNPSIPAPLITVEAAPGGDPTDQRDWTRLRDTARPGPCPHRIRWPDLKTSRKVLLAFTAPLILGSALIGLAILVIAGLLIGIFLHESDMVAIVAAAILTPIAVIPMTGPAACLRIWKRLHRPGLLICVLSTAVLLPLLIAVVVMGAAFRQSALIAVLVPQITVMIVLWSSRSALYDRATCPTFSGLPPQILAMLRHGPETHRAPAASGTAHCPHLLRRRDLRPRHQLLAAARDLAFGAYLLGTLLNYHNAFGAAGLLDPRGASEAVSAVLTAAVVASFHLGSVLDFAARSRRHHRSSLLLHLWGALGYSVAVFLAVDAAAYGSWHAIPVAALTLYAAADMVTALVLLPKRSACRELPPLTPRMLAMLKT